MTKKKRPAGDSTPIKKYENGQYMPYPFGPVQKKAKRKNNKMKIAKA